MKKTLTGIIALFTIGVIYISSVIATVVPLSFVNKIENEIGALSNVATTLFAVFSFLLGSMNYLFYKKFNLYLLIATCGAVSIAFIAEGMLHFNNLCFFGFENCKYMNEVFQKGNSSNWNMVAIFSLMPVAYFVGLHLAGNLATRLAIFVVLKTRKSV